MLTYRSILNALRAPYSHACTDKTRYSMSHLVRRDRTRMQKANKFQDQPNKLLSLAYLLSMQRNFAELDLLLCIIDQPRLNVPLVIIGKSQLNRKTVYVYGPNLCRFGLSQLSFAFIDGCNRN